MISSADPIHREINTVINFTSSVTRCSRYNLTIDWKDGSNYIEYFELQERDSNNSMLVQHSFAAPDVYNVEVGLPISVGL